MKIVVTGGSGFIGSNLITELLKEDNEVVVVDNQKLDDCPGLTEFKDYKNFKFISGDVTNNEDLTPILTQDVDQVYHLAAIVGIKHYVRSPLKLIDVNVMGTKNVLELALKNEIKVLFTSTSEVFGKNPNIPWAEDDDRVLGSTSIHRWNYSTSKALCEHMINAMHKELGLPATIVRYFNAYGPKQQPYFVVSQSVQKVINGKRPILYDSGEQTRCFTFVEDAIKGTIMAANHKNGVGETFNIGNDKETSMKEVIEKIVELSGLNIEPELLDTNKYYGKKYEDIIRRVPNVSKARKVLGWEATTNLDDGLKKTIDWARKNQWWLDLSN